MELPHPADTPLLGYLLEVNSTTEGWSRFMSALLTHFNTRSFHLYVMNQKTQAMRFHVDAGEVVSSDYMALYVERYIHRDYLLRAANSHPTGVFCASNLLPESYRVYDNEHYQQWAKPQGIAEGAVARVYAEGDWTCYMACNRNAQQGGFTEQDVDRLNRLLPFIEKAVRAASTLAESDRNELRAQALVGTFRFPAAVLNEYGELWTLNAAMRHFLSQNSHLIAEQNALRLANPELDKRLNLGILQSSKRASGLKLQLDRSERIELAKDVSLGFHTLSEPNSHGDEIFLGVMVFLMGRNVLTAPHPERLCALFGLTPAEADICQLIIEGYIPKQIASLRDKSVYTVREQLSRVFAKTGCSSQVSLINLLASLPGSQLALGD